MRKSPVIAGGLAGLAILLVLLLPDSDGEPLPAGTTADRVVVEKSRHTLTLYKGELPLRSYEVSLGRGGLAPKRREGDALTPEGAYRISGRNPDSAYHLSLRISYPDARDIAAAKARGEDPGSDIMIHGIRNGLGWLGRLHRYADWTAGCVAVTNREVEEIWRAVPDGTPVELLP